MCKVALKTEYRNMLQYTKKFINAQNIICKLNVFCYLLDLKLLKSNCSNNPTDFFGVFNKSTNFKGIEFKSDVNKPLLPADLLNFSEKLSD